MRQMRRNGHKTVSIPKTLVVRVPDLKPVLVQWRRANPGVNWTWMVRQALMRHLKPFAGKRYQHLCR